MSLVDYVKLVLALAFLFGILYGFLRLSRYAQSRKFSGDMEIVDRLGLDTGLGLYIVRIREKDYLISIGNKQITLLKELS